MTDLHEIKGYNIYCGPGVLSALTGKSTDLCAAVISAVSGANTIKAVQMTHLIESLKRLDFDCNEERVMGVTVFSCLSYLANKDGFYILAVPRHVVAVEIKEKRIYLIDNHTKTAINAASSARLSQKVERILKVVPKPQPTKEELTADRIAYLRNVIDSLNSQISIRVMQRADYIKELEALEKERENDYSS